MPDHDDDERVLARSIGEPGAFAVAYRRHAGAVLYAVVLPLGTGRVHLRALSATGAEVHRTTLRG